VHRYRSCLHTAQQYHSVLRPLCDEPVIKGTSHASALNPLNAGRSSIKHFDIDSYHSTKQYIDQGNFSIGAVSAGNKCHEIFTLHLLFYPRLWRS
jgi:hypothetical protein